MIYVTGDMHAEIQRFNDRDIRHLKKNDILIICGDFGFIWDNSETEQKIISQLSKKRFTIAFVDGTHENFDLLYKYPEVDWNEGKARKISDNIYHMMRGEIYNIEDKKIFTFGGGESDEKETRLSMGTWWKQETPTLAEMKLGVEKLGSVDRKIDYIITHEPPAHIKKIMSMNVDKRNVLTTFFDELSKEVNYKKWFFGSIHVDRAITFKHRALFTDVVPIDNSGRK